MANYLAFPAAVLCLCLFTVVACSSGDVPGTYRSIVSDNYVLSLGLARTAVCLLAKVAASLPAVDLSITFFLFVAYFYEEACQFLVFLLSNWSVVSLACGYVRDTTSRRRRSHRRRAIRCILCLGRCFVRRQWPLLLKQFDDVMRTTCWTPVALRPVPVPTAAQASIVAYLRERVLTGGVAVLGNGRNALEAGQWCEQGEGNARVILTWHIATSIFGAKHPHRNATVAATLSKYCARLPCGFPPGAPILPDDLNDIQHVYKAMVRELKEAFGSWGYYSLPQTARLEKLAEIAAPASSSLFGKGTDKDSILRNGAVLGSMALSDKVEQGVTAEEDRTCGTSG